MFYNGSFETGWSLISNMSIVHQTSFKPKNDWQNQG